MRKAIREGHGIIEGYGSVEVSMAWDGRGSYAFGMRSDEAPFLAKVGHLPLVAGPSEGLHNGRI